jgi:hypothetical protein
MPLVDLKTNLKSLRYGNDQQGGGSSNQPYIQTPIPDQLPNQGYDTYLRNGSLYGQSAKNDFDRIELFLKSPLGENWVTKQKDLSRQSTWRFPLSLPVSQIYREKQTLDQIKLKDNTFSPEGGPWIHIYKQGGLSLPSLGYLNPLNYGNAYKLADQAGINRLTNLYRTKVSTSQNLIGQAAQIANSVLLGVTPDIFPGSDLFLQTYYGGTDNYGTPVSIIPRTTFSTNKLRSFDGSLFNNNQNIITFDQNFLGNLTVGSTSTGVTQGANLFLPSLLKPETFIYSSNSVVTYTDFRKTLKDAPTGIGAVVPKSKKDKLAATDYRIFNRQTKYRTGNPGVKNVNRSNPYQPIPNSDATTADELNLTPLYNSDKIDPLLEYADLIKFSISVVNNNNPSQRTWIQFRAFIDSFGDTFNASWNEYKYVGRADSMFRYGGFNRDISLGFKVFCQSRQEQLPMYQKLNYLASLAAPSYTDSGFMRGNYVYLTVGDWLVNVPGVLKGISLGVPQDSPWEIARDANGNIQNDIAQLPHYVEVSGFNFAPIHNFVPQLNSPFIGNPVSGSQSNYFASPPLNSLPNRVAGPQNQTPFNFTQQSQ